MYCLIGIIGFICCCCILLFCKIRSFRINRMRAMSLANASVYRISIHDSAHNGPGNTNTSNNNVEHQGSVRSQSQLSYVQSQISQMSQSGLASGARSQNQSQSIQQPNSHFHQQSISSAIRNNGVGGSSQQSYKHNLCQINKLNNKY